MARYVPISIIVTTYNRPDALESVLRGLARQSDRDFEVDHRRRRLDAGHRRPVEVLAQPAAAADQAYLAGASRIPRRRDPQPRDPRQRRRLLHLPGRRLHSPPDFVLEHRALAEPGWFVVGNRVLMSRQLTESVLSATASSRSFGPSSRLVVRASTATSTGLRRCCRRGSDRCAKSCPQYWWGARSCNLAVWRTDLDRVDGFDASYVGWGLEDSDLLIRLLRAGINRKDGRFSTGVLHLWHPLADPSLLSANQIAAGRDPAHRPDRLRERAVVAERQRRDAFGVGRRPRQEPDRDRLTTLMRYCRGKRLAL